MRPSLDQSLRLHLPLKISCGILSIFSVKYKMSFNCLVISLDHQNLHSLSEVCQDTY